MEVIYCYHRINFPKFWIFLPILYNGNIFLWYLLSMELTSIGRISFWSLLFWKKYGVYEIIWKWYLMSIFSPVIIDWTSTISKFSYLHSTVKMFVMIFNFKQFMYWKNKSISLPLQQLVEAGSYKNIQMQLDNGFGWTVPYNIADHHLKYPWADLIRLRLNDFLLIGGIYKVIGLKLALFWINEY